MPPSNAFPVKEQARTQGIKPPVITDGKNAVRVQHLLLAGERKHVSSVRRSIVDALKQEALVVKVLGPAAMRSLSEWHARCGVVYGAGLSGNLKLLQPKEWQSHCLLR